MAGATDLPEQMICEAGYNASAKHERGQTKKDRRGIHLIAELANVSIGTVDRALHGRAGINESTRQRILKIAEQIAYTPNLAARSLSVSKASARIGVCIPREIHFFYDQLWGGVLDEARSVAQHGIQFVYRPVQTLGEADTEAFKELVTGRRERNHSHGGKSASA